MAAIFQNGHHWQYSHFYSTIKSNRLVQFEWSCCQIIHFSLCSIQIWSHGSLASLYHIQSRNPNIRLNMRFTLCLMVGSLVVCVSLGGPHCTHPYQSLNPNIQLNLKLLLRLTRLRCMVAHGITLCLVSTIRAVRHGCPCQEFNTPASIALGVTETHKLPHHDKVMIPPSVFFFFPFFNLCFFIYFWVVWMVAGDLEPNPTRTALWGPLGPIVKRSRPSPLGPWSRPSPKSVL